MLKQLKAKRKAAVDKMAALLNTAAEAERDLTEAEKTEFDQLKADSDSLKEQIARFEAVDGLQAEVSQVQPAAARGAGIVRAGGPEAKREFESFGEFMHSVRFRPNDQRLSSLWHEQTDEGSQGGHRSEHNTTDGPSGGFAIPKIFLPMLQPKPGQEAIFRGRATVLGAGETPDAEVTMPALNQTDTNARGGVTVTWIAEGAAKPATEMKLKEISLRPQEVAAKAIFTDKLLRNWGAAGPMMEKLFREAVATAEDRAFFRGDGVGKPKGLLNSGAIIGINRTTNALVKFADLANMLGRFKGNSPIWMYNPTVLPQLVQLADASGRSIWVGGDITRGIPDTLMGYPAVKNEHCPALNTKGDFWLADLSSYLIKDGSGPFVAASEHVYFESNKTVFKITFNVDGQSWSDAPLIGEDSATYSPFITLNTGVP